MPDIEGKDSLIYIKVAGLFRPIGCLTSNSFSETTETIDTTTRQNGGWKTAFPTLQSYSISLSGMAKLVRDGFLLSYHQLRELKRSRTIFEWQIKTAGMPDESGRGFITEISNEAPAEDYITFSVTIQGFGKPDYVAAERFVLANEAGQPIEFNKKQYLEVK